MDNLVSGPCVPADESVSGSVATQTGSPAQYRIVTYDP